jgi:hypothetical protein
MPIDPLNKLCKWRSILAGWHRGSGGVDEPGVKAMRDLMDKWLVMRCEASALASLMISKGVCTIEEFNTQLQGEAVILDNQMERTFPGFRTIAAGVEIYDTQLAAETTKRLGFPP